MLETDLQHGVRRGRFLRSEQIARRYEKGDKSCPNGRKRFARAWSASIVLDAHASENWRKFLMQFEIYLVAKAKDEKPDKLKVNMLLHCAGPEAIEEYSHFVFNAGESNERYDDVCKKFKELCEGARNVIYERLVFNQRNQKEGERIDNFVSELKRLSLTCEFGDLKDSLIRDRIVGGVLSDEL